MKLLFFFWGGGVSRLVDHQHGQGERTRSCNFTDGLVLLFGHETDNGEDGESREEAGARIDGAD